MTFLALIPPSFYNVLQYGAKVDGVTDDTTALAAALSAANNAGGGTVFVPAGTLITGNQTLYSNVYLLGAGVDATIIKLKNGTNADLFSANTGSINLAGAYGGGSNTGVHSFGFSNMTLDGNKANQSSGTSYIMRFYGYKTLLHNVFLQNGYSGGILCDWHPGIAVNGSESRFSNVSVYGCNGWGIETGGPTDCQWDNVVVGLSSVGNVHICPNGGGLQVSTAHTWNLGTGTTIGWLVEADTCTFSNTEAEAEGKFMMVMLGKDFTFRGGRIFAGSLGSTAGGIQIGQQAGQTPYAGQILQSAGVTIANAPTCYTIHTNIDGITASSGGIWFANDGGYGDVRAICELSAGKLAYTGTPFSGGDSLLFLVNGATLDGSVAAGGGMSVGASSYTAFSVINPSGHAILNVDTYDSTPIVQLGTGATFKMLDGSGNNLFSVLSGQFFFGTAFDTSLYRGGAGILQTDGAIATGQSASAAAIANNGTITTAGIGEARVAPTGNVTGIILQAGTAVGQECVVVNESAFTVTFDVVGTSHVADGTSAVIAANRCMFFKWDSSTSKWYHS